ncbi:MAG: alpha-glucosidase/alpha-galactosidase, partial [Clostridiales bacterium]|nr:alpha-glucosidase/alpha-galactosidase [Clostridiales bacterium]
ALYDIDAKRLAESLTMLEAINANCNENRAVITSYSDRLEALRGADFVINAVQVGGYDPCTKTDFEIPKKYGLRQTIADTIGIGGIFRGLRTIPVMLDFADDMEKVCPDALFINYTNPMSILTGAMLRYTKIKTIGLCHSVQVCASTLLKNFGLPLEGITYKIAGINHMGWLLELKRNGIDIYPEIRKLAVSQKGPDNDQVRLEMLRTFGYYVTESSEHNAEYMPYWIKDKYPGFIKRFNIPLDEYPRRCEAQIEKWNAIKNELVNNPALDHSRTSEYASYIIEAIVTNKPFTFGGNVINNGLIPNLPPEACVEVMCVADGGGITPGFAGRLPEHLAALNRTNINVHLLTIEAAVTKKRENIYYAAMLDPHTASELSLDDIKDMCDDLIEAHGSWLPRYSAC